MTIWMMGSRSRLTIWIKIQRHTIPMREMRMRMTVRMWLWGHGITESISIGKGGTISWISAERKIRSKPRFVITKLENNSLWQAWYGKQSPNCDRMVIRHIRVSRYGCDETACRHWIRPLTIFTLKGDHESFGGENVYLNLTDDHWFMKWDFDGRDMITVGKSKKFWVFYIHPETVWVNGTL